MRKLIDMEAAIDIVRYECGEWEGLAKEIIKQFNELPPVDAVPVSRGSWTEREVSDEPIDEWQSARCSVCGKYHTTPYLYNFDNFDYCPNCGANMREEDRNEKIMCGMQI